MRYLEQHEKAGTLPLWREAFPDDTEEFLEYYYTEKVRDNRILAEEENGRIVSMLHRNPYQLRAGCLSWRADYIVAVATAEDRRHRGLMRGLFKKMLDDMYQEGMPFCFLMPADRKIYEPMDFVYVFDQPHWRLTEAAERRLCRYVADDRWMERAAKYMQQWLENRYEVFVVRDESYVQRLVAELESENGWMEILREPDETKSAASGGGMLSLCGAETEIAGIRCWWGGEQRMLLCREEDREEEKDAAPAIMARIVHLEKFLEAIRLSEASTLDSLDVKLTVRDSLCAENQGTFLWKIGKRGSRLLRPGEERAAEAEQTGRIPRLEAGIGELTGWLFGYEQAEHLPGAGEWMKSVRTLRGVFLDEAV